MYPFNVRVYGLILQGDCVLISDEKINGYEMTKFPGGGLEYGEGTIDGLKREFREELQVAVHVNRHFYTTDFFIPSAFNKSQVISIYYLVEAGNLPEYPQSLVPSLFNDSPAHTQQYFRWLPLSEISEKHFTFAGDKKVAELLKNAI